MDDILLSTDEEDLAVEAAEPSSPLFELSSSLMAELPIKRGLSKFFNGKSQSFSSLSQVKCTEDLVKKECLFSIRRKICRSMKKIPYYGQNCSSRLVSKKASRYSSGSIIARSKSTPVSVQKSYLYVFIKGEDE